MRAITVIFSALLLGACASEPRVDESGVQRLLEAELPSAQQRVSLRAPYYLGVYFKPPRSTDSQVQPEWIWSEQDRSQVFRVLTRLKKLGVLSGYTELRVTKLGPAKKLEEAADLANVDAILTVHGVGDVDVGRNRAAKLYPLLLTTLFVPGHDVVSIFKAGATLSDTQHQLAFSTAVAEGAKQGSAPMWFTDDVSALSQARSEAIRTLKSPLYKAFIELAFGPEPPHP